MFQPLWNLPGWLFATAKWNSCHAFETDISKIGRDAKSQCVSTLGRVSGRFVPGVKPRGGTRLFSLPRDSPLRCASHRPNRPLRVFGGNPAIGMIVISVRRFTPFLGSIACAGEIVHRWDLTSVGRNLLFVVWLEQTWASIRACVSIISVFSILVASDSVECTQPCCTPLA